MTTGVVVVGLMIMIMMTVLIIIILLVIMVAYKARICRYICCKMYADPMHL